MVEKGTGDNTGLQRQKTGRPFASKTYAVVLPRYHKFITGKREIIYLLGRMHTNMGCTKENEPIKTNDGNDTIPVHDTLTNDTLTLCDSAICTFDSICLDYHFYDTIDKTKLIGEWKLIAYVDTINCEIVNEPSNIPRNIVLNFYENDSISGESVSNSITGKYSINSNKISLYDLNITLVMEPEWGRTFLESINYTEYFTIKNSLLIINSKEILIFQKNNL